MPPAETSSPPAPLWTPASDRARATKMFAFMQSVNAEHGTSFTEYEELRAWSVANVGDFWGHVWSFLGIEAHTPFDAVVDDPSRMPGARWFQGATLNFAENLLRYRDDRPAIIFRGEAMAESRRLTYAQLATAVARTAQGLRNEGVEPGDRVVGFMPNMPETVIAMLAATSLGAVWSSCSPDFGVKGVLDRFARIEPRVLFTADGYSYGGRVFDSLEKVEGIVAALPTTPRVVVVPYANPDADLTRVPGAVAYSEFAGSGDPALDFASLPFDHPLYIMYSSGTTGLPKCIVQSAGGVLVNQLKELVLHTDLKREDNIFYFTTCGWMMWNWLVASLGVGATMTLFDGSPFHPDASALMRLAAQERVTIFGASAKYFSSLEKAGVQPRKHFDLDALDTILSTGSPLAEESFDFVYESIKADLCLSSIAGGTDLNGCFVGGNPMGPVYRGEIQCRCLGMDVKAFDDDGEPVIGHTGELVCAQAFPSMPIYFWGDDDGTAYRRAYFERFDGVWTHGDFIEINERGGVRIYGRSDATLNPGGVRIGTAEIYRQVEPLEEIADSLVIGQEWEDDVRVVLFVKLADDHTLSPELARRIRSAIKSNCSPRHVPARIVAVDDIPYTISMKKVELAVRDIVHGRPVKNRDALKNPEALDLFVDLPDLRE
ncbi:MAG: acetoacetate--CoA ligase [Phycisphaerales bacterium]|nr:acetoacetate--CoA ligase [Phycisphaerae bacterium]NNF42421.1 acetoacetate--CoA ligase [Phycisphaerales bacterium]NNM27018.1 acetoacetate--CoA ligase [Phycisphaerales bacterium]